MLKPNRAEGVNAQQAAAQLVLHFGRWVDATRAGEPAPEPDTTAPESGDAVANAFGRIADHLGLGTQGQRVALIDLLAGMADMIGTQGAELEGVLHPILHPESGPRLAMVLRARVPDSAPSPEDAAFARGRQGRSK